MNNQPPTGARSAKTERPGSLVAILILIAGAVILTLPMLIYGPYPEGHDIYQHLTFSRHFNAQFWAGELYPRWLIDQNFGLGSPTFFVYPPLPSFVYALLDPLTRAVHVDTFVAENLLLMALSGVFAFLWVRTLASGWIPVAAGLLYMLAPYHLKVNLYERTALAESWALVWMPLLLYFTSRIAGRRRGAMVLFGVAYGLFILTHLISALIFSPVALAAAFYLTAKSERLRAAVNTGMAMCLGAGLSAVYLIPALANARNFPSAKYVPPVATYLISLGNLSPHFKGYNFTHTIALTGLNAMVVCGLCGVLAIARGSVEAKRFAWLWMAVCGCAGFMMLALSAPVWKRLPILLGLLQYPFRLNLMLCVAAPALLALVLSDREWASRIATGVRVLLVVFVVLPWLYSYATVWRLYREIPNPRGELASQKESFLNDGWFLAWPAKGTEMASAQAANAGPRVRFTTGSGTADVMLWTPRHIAFKTDSAAGGQVMVNQFYYPSWQATTGSGQQLGVSAELPEGLIQIPTPAGAQEIRLDLPASAAEQAGRWVSGLALLVAALLAWRERRATTV